MKLRATVTVYAFVTLATGRVIATPPAPACLPPRAASCVQSSKKDLDARAITPVLHTPLATLFHMHTREAVAVEPESGSDEEELLARFLRDRTSWELHSIAPGCMATLRKACTALRARRVEIISGYRSDKLNEMLRKKGRHVAKHSQHTQGQAVDFRLVGVPTRVLLRYVRNVHQGGIGFYPNSEFVHVDVGPVRQWRGE